MSFPSSPRHSIGSHGSTSSAFSWSPNRGAAHLHDWPLGHATSHDRYIQPVPPMYVTEYEASYTWPEVWEQKKAVAALAAAQEEVRAKAAAEAKEEPWKVLERAVEKLATHNAADEAVHGHRLDETIEKVYRTYKAKLAAKSTAAAEEKKKDDAEGAEPSEEAMRLFCEGVEAVKRGSAGGAGGGSSSKGKPAATKAMMQK